ncbi:Uncharacterised protein [Mycobacteroides abscessus subsp. abscessus]|nr:Uncharacterised protein [Mycobacteroides abscessus subsp. abscessus]
MAALPFSVLRTAMMTCAPTRASSRAVSRPSPLLAPVMMTVRPSNDGSSAALHLAVDLLTGADPRRWRPAPSRG